MNCLGGFSVYGTCLPFSLVTCWDLWLTFGDLVSLDSTSLVLALVGSFADFLVWF